MSLGLVAERLAYYSNQVQNLNGGLRPPTTSIPPKPPITLSPPLRPDIDTFQRLNQEMRRLNEEMQRPFGY